MGTGSTSLRVTAVLLPAYLLVQLLPPLPSVVLTLLLAAVLLLRSRPLRWLARPAAPGRYWPLLVPALANLWGGAAMPDPASGAVLLLLHLVSAAVCEELLFRGFLLEGLRRSRVRRPALITALCFSLLHLLGLPGAAETVLVQAVVSFSLGLLFAVVTQQSGSLLPAVLTHCAINATSVVAAVQGPNLWLWGGLSVLALLWTAALCRPVMPGADAGPDESNQ